jgi:hypothetical protein
MLILGLSEAFGSFCSFLPLHWFLALLLFGSMDGHVGGV